MFPQTMVGDLPRRWLTALRAFAERQYGLSSPDLVPGESPQSAAEALEATLARTNVVFAAEAEIPSNMPLTRKWYMLAGAQVAATAAAAAAAASESESVATIATRPLSTGSKSVVPSSRSVASSVSYDGLASSCRSEGVTVRDQAVTLCADAARVVASALPNDEELEAMCEEALSRFVHLCCLRAVVVFSGLYVADCVRACVLLLLLDTAGWCFTCWVTPCFSCMRWRMWTTTSGSTERTVHYGASPARRFARCCLIVVVPCCGSRIDHTAVAI